MSATLYSVIGWASVETLYMVFFSTLFAVVIGFPLGTLLFSSAVIQPHALTYRVLSGIVNTSRSVPFIILLVAIIPLTRLLVGTSIGVNAAIVPLTLGAAPFFARLVENALQRLPRGLIDTGFAIGATQRQMLWCILLPEARPALVQAITVTAITLVNYSAMAGTVGGGGLGDLAIRYGYQRFDVKTMLVTVFLLVVLVQSIQWLGDYLAQPRTTQETTKCSR